MKKILKEYIFITIGMTLVAAGVYYFLVPVNLAAGGVSGLAIVINKYLPFMAVGLLMILMNIVLFVIGILFLGSNFGAKTVYASIGLSGEIWIFEKFFPMTKPFTNDLFLDMIYGIVIAGIGLGIVFNQNASTGGTDIIAKIINKYFHIDIGKALLMSDFFITLAAGITFGAEIGMYGLLGVIINGFVVDNVIEGLNVCKEVVIISSKSDTIKAYIIDNLGRGVTVYSAKGAYTGDDRDVLVTVMSRKQFIRLRDFIKELDSRAFITVSNVHEVLGEGFKEIDEL